MGRTIFLRARQRAREDAARWGTVIVVVRDGKLAREYPGQPDRPSQVERDPDRPESA